MEDWLSTGTTSRQRRTPVEPKRRRPRGWTEDAFICDEEFHLQMGDSPLVCLTHLTTELNRKGKATKLSLTPRNEG